MPANRTLALLRALTVTSALGFAVVPRIAVAQTATDTTTTTTTTTTTPASATEAPEGEEPTVLSPFVVDAAEDRGSYRAESTLAGTRVRTDLKDVASAISVVTAQFLQDTGAKNAEDLLVYTPSTEVAGLRGNFSGVAGSAVVQENTVDTSTRVRGLDSADNTRDYFLTDIPWDAFDVGRVDLQRGPNSILFGTGSPAGIINVSTDGAAFNNAYNITNRFDEYGSLRDSVSINQELVPGVLAIRLAVLQDNEKYEQSPAFNNTSRYYGAFRLDPKLFGKDSHTSIRGDWEKGHQTSDNPRDIPPADEITTWFTSTLTIGGVTNPGYNKITENQYSLTNPTAGGNVPGASGGPESANYFQLGGFAQGRSYWPDVINYYEGTPLALNTVSGALAPSGTPIKVITAQANEGLAPGATISGISTFRPDAVPPFSLIADFIGVNDTINNGNEPFKTIPGGAYYNDRVITDKSIFDFYKNLLDGPNKHEWKNWQAFNIAIDQSFFDDRFAFEISYDQQTYTEGDEPFLEGENYAINVDVNDTYADGTANPNVGRPYVANATSGGEDNNYVTTTTRQTYRFTPVVELRSTDFFSSPTATWLLGKSVFTGLYEKNTVVASTYQFAEFATTPDYTTSNFANNTAADGAANTENSNRSYEFLVYIGPSLMNASSAAGSNLNNLNYVIAPPEHEQTLNFNSTWDKPTDPSAPGYVNPAAPYTYTSYTNGTTTNVATQVANPANYVGWTNQQISYMAASNPTDLPDLISSASRTRFTDESQGITWQGYLLGGDLVPSLGWRKDKVTNYQTNALQDPNTGFVSLNYPDNLQSRTDVTGTSKTWGGVYHLPKSLMSKLPGDMTFSVLLNRSENFKPDAQRLSLAGLPIPNASGTTTEYGFVITGLSDKITLKVDWFKTLVKNASLGETNGNSIAGLGSNAYFVADGMIWGYAWATSLQDGLRGNLGNGVSSVTPGTNYWDYGAGSGYAVGSPQYIATNSASTAIVNAWINNPFPATFFSSYALSPPINPLLAKTTGLLGSGYLDGDDDTNGPFTGGGSNFGDHQTTVDNLSKGIEIELSAQPTRNWNVTLNYTHVNATHADIDPITQQFISQMTGFLNGPAGQIRMWDNSATGNLLSGDWNSSIVAPWTVQLNDQGHEAPEVSPWRLNLISTYTFDRGPAKGWFVGGALRMEAARILGYRYDPTFENINAADPNYASVTAVTQGGLNVNEPIMGPTDTHVDAWIGYSRKLYRNVNWRIQLNLQSVGEKDHLVAAGYNPDGSLYLARIQEGMGWRLENSFDF
jgi:outer membrane receptor protein involved in Fe transport